MKSYGIKQYPLSRNQANPSFGNVYIPNKELRTVFHSVGSGHYLTESLSVRCQSLARRLTMDNKQRIQELRRKNAVLMEDIARQEIEIRELVKMVREVETEQARETGEIEKIERKKEVEKR